MWNRVCFCLAVLTFIKGRECPVSVSDGNLESVLTQDDCTDVILGPGTFLGTGLTVSKTTTIKGVEGSTFWECGSQSRCLTVLAPTIIEGIWFKEGRAPDLLAGLSSTEAQQLSLRNKDAEHVTIQNVLNQSTLASCDTIMREVSPGELRTYHCPANCGNEEVYGTCIYNAFGGPSVSESHLCAAAQHAGVLARGVEGNVTLEVFESPCDFELVGTLRNGVQSRFLQSLPYVHCFLGRFVDGLGVPFSCEHASPHDASGGVINVQATSLVLRNSRVSSGRAVMGGGLAVRDGSLLLADTLIDECWASVSGAGLFARNSSVQIHRSSFISNVIHGLDRLAYAGLWGGVGFFFAGVGHTVEVVDSTFRNNRFSLVVQVATRMQEIGGGGLGFYSSGGLLRLTNSVFDANVVQASGPILRFNTVGGSAFFASGLLLNLEIIGCTIANNVVNTTGTHDQWWAEGGGIRILQRLTMRFVMRHTVVVFNVALAVYRAFGAGIHIEVEMVDHPNTTIRFEHCVISNNQAHGSVGPYNRRSGARGGGFFLQVLKEDPEFTSTQLFFVNTTFRHNLAKGTRSRGGAMYLRLLHKTQSIDALALRCEGNRVEADDGRGGGIWFEYAVTSFVNSSFNNNVVLSHADARGGGLYMQAVWSTFHRTEVVGNVVKCTQCPRAFAGGMCISTSSSGVLSLVSIANNTVVAPFSLGAGLGVEEQSVAHLDRCNIQNNTVGAHSIGSSTCVSFFNETGSAETTIADCGRIDFKPDSDPYMLDAKAFFWSIRLSTEAIYENLQLHLSFPKFELDDHPQCPSQGVELFDGPSVNSPRIGLYCGGKLFNGVKTTLFCIAGRCPSLDAIIPTGPTVTVRYFSQRNTEQRETGGFIMEWRSNSSRTEQSGFNPALPTDQPVALGGGVIAVGQCSLNMTQCRVVGNTAIHPVSAGGGGVACTLGSKCVVANSVLEANRVWSRSEAGGAAVHVAHSQLLLTHSWIHGNMATTVGTCLLDESFTVLCPRTYGGGVLLWAPLLNSTLHSVSIHNNSALCSGQRRCTATGGGFVLHRGKAGLYGTRITRNLVKCHATNCETDGGGAGLVATGSLEIGASSLSGNIARCDFQECVALGGGLSVVGQNANSVRLLDSSLLGNSVLGSGKNTQISGGGVACGGSCQLHATNCTVASSGAKLGAAFWFAQASFAELTDLVIRNNSADVVGGAFALTDTAFVKLSSSILAHNTAVRAQALFSLGGQLAMAQCEVVGTNGSHALAMGEVSALMGGGSTWRCLHPGSIFRQESHDNFIALVCQPCPPGTCGSRAPLSSLPQAMV